MPSGRDAREAWSVQRRNPVATNKYPGFGNQIWHGARLLGGYGEGKNGSTVALYRAGISCPTYAARVYPANLATYKLYVYNPSVDGNTRFWNIYNARFGDPTWRANTRSTSTRLAGVTRVKINKTSKVTGRVYPRSAAGAVTIVRTRLVGGRWRSAGTAKVPVVNGAYTYRFKPTRRGDWRITARYTGGTSGGITFKPSKSTVKKLKVR